MVAQPINYQPFEVDDFSGGITDNYISGAINKAKVMNNLLIVPHGSPPNTKGKLKSRNGSEIFDSDDPLMNVSSLTRISALKYFQDEIISFHQNNLKYQNSAGDWTNLLGPVDSNPIFTTSSDASNVVSLSSWQNHLFIANDRFEYISKVYKDSSGDWQARTAGLPDLSSSPDVTAGSSGADSFLYRFGYKYTYNVGTVQYIDRGPLTEVLLENSAAPNSNAVSITNIPVLSNSGTLWDTSSIEIEISRTITGGESEFYIVKTVSNGTTSTSDSTSDSVLLTNQPLYTNGGRIENDLTPLAKVIHIVDDTSTAYYGAIKDGSEENLSLVRQSIPGDPDSCPETFFVGLGDEVVGISSARGRTVVLCKNSVHRIDGVYDSFGVGGMIPQKISDSATCVSSQSVVQTLDGVFWAGEDGFYWTDGYNVKRLNIDWVQTYKTWVSSANQKKRIQGKYDVTNRRIWWTVQADSASSDCDSCAVLHLDWGVNAFSSFTTISGGDSFRPSAIEFNGETMYRGDSQGYLYWHKPSFSTDPVKNTSQSDVTKWATQTIIWTYESTAYNLGTSRVRKISPWISVTAQNATNLSLSIVSINDDGRIEEELKPIRYRSNVTWGDELITWGDPDIIWNAQGLIEEQRRFPRKSFRYNYKQIKLTNAKVVIQSSHVIGNGSSDSSTSTFSLDESNMAFISSAVGYFIALEADNYVTEYEITAINTSNDTVTLDTSVRVLPDVSDSQWVMRGYPKGEVLDLISYSFDHALLGKTQKFFDKDATGELS